MTVELVPHLFGANPSPDRPAWLVRPVPSRRPARRCRRRQGARQPDPKAGDSPGPGLASFDPTHPPHIEQKEHDAGARTVRDHHPLPDNVTVGEVPSSTTTTRQRRPRPFFEPVEAVAQRQRPSTPPHAPASSAVGSSSRCRSLTSARSGRTLHAHLATGRGRREPVDPGTVLVTVRGSAGTAVVTGQATTGTGSGPRQYVLTAAQTRQIDVLSVDWTVGGDVRVSPGRCGGPPVVPRTPSWAAETAMAAAVNFTPAMISTARSRWRRRSSSGAGRRSCPGCGRDVRGDVGPVAGVGADGAAGAVGRVLGR